MTSRPLPAPAIVTGLSLMFGALSACATPDRAAPLAIPVEVAAPRGVAMGAPAVTRTRDGIALRGRICRGSATLPPTFVRLEQRDATGADVAAVTRALPNLAYRGQPCAIYALAAPWTLAPDTRVRLCATRDPRACHAAP